MQVKLKMNQLGRALVARQGRTMNQHKPDAAGSQILHPINRKLFQCWNALRNGKKVPRRADLALKSIGPILSHVAIIEATKLTEGVRFRLAGTALRSIFCRELTNTDLFDPWNTKDKLALRAMLSMALDDTEPINVRFTVHASETHVETVEAVFLPMQEKGQFLASFASFAQPYWLGTHRIIKQEILSIRTITTAGNASECREPIALVSLTARNNVHQPWPGFRVISGGHI
jgi:hypothetical protein